MKAAAAFASAPASRALHEAFCEILEGLLPPSF
jgi:hypothetical protein